MVSSWKAVSSPVTRSTKRVFIPKDWACFTIASISCFCFSSVWAGSVKKSSLGVTNTPFIVAGLLKEMGSWEGGWFSPSFSVLFASSSPGGRGSSLLFCVFPSWFSSWPGGSPGWVSFLLRSSRAETATTTVIAKKTHANISIVCWLSLPRPFFLFFLGGTAISS